MKERIATNKYNQQKDAPMASDSELLFSVPSPLQTLRKTAQETLGSTPLSDAYSMADCESWIDDAKGTLCVKIDSN